MGKLICLKIRRLTVQVASQRQPQIGFPDDSAGGVNQPQYYDTNLFRENPLYTKYFLYISENQYAGQKNFREIL